MLQREKLTFVAYSAMLIGKIQIKYIKLIKYSKKSHHCYLLVLNNRDVIIWMDSFADSQQTTYFCILYMTYNVKGWESKAVNSSHKILPVNQISDSFVRKNMVIYNELIGVWNGTNKYLTSERKGLDRIAYKT